MKNLKLLIILLLFSLTVRGQMTDFQLGQEADTIKYETTLGANTPYRVGRFLNNIVSNKVNVNTLWSNPSFINTLAWSKITGTPTTLAGYGITNGTVNPMTTAGDLIIGGASGAPARLGAGSTSGHVLTSNGAGVAPSWQAVAGGGGAIWGNITGTLSSQTDLNTALGLKAALASPTFTGTPTLPTGTIATTQSAANSTTAVATTAFVTTADNLKANLASPTLTGTPTLPTGTIATTQSALNSTTAVATTAFVTTADNLKADIASPTLTGTPAAPTASGATNSTQIATTAFVKTSTMKYYPIPSTDMVSTLTTGTSKSYFRVPHAMTVTAVRASLLTAQSSGSVLTIDINDSGTTILSTKLTIDNNETTSLTAASAVVISDTALADDAIITFDIDQVGTGGIALIVTLIGY